MMVLFFCHAKRIDHQREADGKCNEVEAGTCFVQQHCPYAKEQRVGGYDAKCGLE